MPGWNLAIRFVLELTTLFALGSWGYSLTAGPSRYLYAIAVPLVAAALWGVFAVEGDPSRSGNTVIPTPGLIRLVLELSFFAAGVWALHTTGRASMATTMAVVVGIHYFAGYQRVLWLFER